MAENNGVEVLYFEVKPLPRHDCLTAPFVSVQIITGLPTRTKADHSGPSVLCVFYRSALLADTCVVVRVRSKNGCTSTCGCVFVLCR